MLRQRKPFERYGAYVWCLHCERVHACRNDGYDLWRCQTPGCDGTRLDLGYWAADKWPRNAHPEYPEIPVPGKHYPLY